MYLMRLRPIHNTAPSTRARRRTERPQNAHKRHRKQRKPGRRPAPEWRGRQADGASAELTHRSDSPRATSPVGAAGGERRPAAAAGPPRRRSLAEQPRRGLLALELPQRLALLADPSSGVAELLLELPHRALSTSDLAGWGSSSVDCLHTSGTHGERWRGRRRAAART